MADIINTGLTLVATTGINEIVKVAVGSYLKPKLDKYFNNTEKEKRTYLIEEAITDYLDRTYNHYLTMNTIVFKNRQKKINDLYIPLTVAKRDKKNNIKIFINRFRDDFIPLYKKILLVDSAGMGKSTIIKYLYLSSITEKKGIPILIELRKLDKDTSIIDFIMNELNGIRQYFDNSNILDLIEEGDFIFFFDGYDEIASEAKKKVTQNLQEFISNTSNNTFIISSRDENELACFGDFQRFDIQPLKKEEAYSLIQKYDNNDEISQELIQEIETRESMEILKEFLENPLMVSLLYKSYGYKRTVPMKKSMFYRQVYDALYEEHDLSKGGAFNHPKKSMLDLEDFHRILRSIGFVSLAKGVSYSKEEFIKIIQQAKKKNADLQFSESDFISDVTLSVPLFIKDGIEYRWTHKSFQEYFAASYIFSDAKEKQGDLLTNIAGKNIIKYYNVLDFYYDIDYKQFSRIILYPIIKDLETFFKDKYNDKHYFNFHPEEIKLRKHLEFNYKHISIRLLNKEEIRECRKKGYEGIELFDYFFGSGSNFPGTITELDYGVIFESTQIERLLNLLYNKKSKIVEKIKVVLGRESDDINLLIEELEAGKYKVNDYPENRINNKKVFNLINSYIVYTRYNSNNQNFVLFDYNKCMDLKKEIELELEEEKNDIGFL